MFLDNSVKNNNPKTNGVLFGAVVYFSNGFLRSSSFLLRPFSHGGQWQLVIG